MTPTVQLLCLLGEHTSLYKKAQINGFQSTAVKIGLRA